MSIAAETFYTIKCDHLGCPSTLTEFAYEDTSHVTSDELADLWSEHGEENGWKRVQNEGSHYCPEHAAIYDDVTGADLRPLLDPTPTPPPLFGPNEIAAYHDPR